MELDTNSPKENADIANRWLDALKANKAVDMNLVSDGFHTFGELYEFRKQLNAALFNTWYKLGVYNTHKSLKHGDGELCFNGEWFIVMATLPTGQISNHYRIEDWDLFQIPELPQARPWDGHTAGDVIERLEQLNMSKGDLWNAGHQL